MSSRNTTREKILETALEWISKNGTAGLTTRKIAQLARVNAASTNYYFRSKEALAEEAILLFMERISVVFSFLEDQSLPLAKRVYLFISGYMEKLLEHPGILKTQMIAMLQADQPIPSFLESKKYIFDRFQTLLPAASKKVMAPRFTELVAAVVYPVLTQQYVKGYCGLDLTRKQDRDLYVKTILKDLMDLEIET